MVPLQSPFESNVLSILLFYGLLEELIWDALQFPCYGHFDDLYAFKTGPFDDLPELEDKKKSHTKQDQVNRDAVLEKRCFNRPEIAGCSGHLEQVYCCSKEAMIYPTTTLVSSRVLGEKYAAASLCRIAD